MKEKPEYLLPFAQSAFTFLRELPIAFSMTEKLLINLFELHIIFLGGFQISNPRLSHLASMLVSEKAHKHPYSKIQRVPHWVVFDGKTQHVALRKLQVFVYWSFQVSVLGHCIKNTGLKQSSR